MKAAAAEASRRGWVVFPVGGETYKRPLVKWREYDRAPDDWATHGATGYGIDCGRSGLVVLDEDQPGALAALCDKHGETLPPTFTVKTAKGRHLYFLAPDDVSIRNSASALVVGLDVRGRGGYVVGPGSGHASGVPYETVDARNPVALPEWLVKLLGRPLGLAAPSEGRPPAYSDETGEWGRAVLSGAVAKISAAREGERNDTLRNEALHVAALTKGGHIERREALDGLRNAAQACGLGCEEVEATLAGAARDADPYPTLEQMFPDLPELADSSAPGVGQDGLTAFERAAADAVESATNPPPVLTPVYFNPLGTPLFYGGVLNTLVGPGGIMKTTLATLAASNHAGHTLFVSLEKSRPSLLNTAHWAGADTSRMLIATSTDEAEAIIQSAPPSADLLVVVDSTLSLMARYGWNEDTSSDVGALEACLMKWYATGRVGCIVLIDHTGHNTHGRARGSSRKGQMVQGRVWVLQRSGGLVTATCEKDNSGERAASWTYDLTPTGPVASLQALPDVPVEEVALTVTGMWGAGFERARKAVRAHPDYREWKAAGLTCRKLQNAEKARRERESSFHPQPD